VTKNLRTRVQGSVFLLLRRRRSKDQPRAARTIYPALADTRPLWGPSSELVPGDPAGTVRGADGTITYL
jgi:hypothetical protein